MKIKTLKKAIEILEDIYGGDKTISINYDICSVIVPNHIDIYENIDNELNLSLERKEGHDNTMAINKFDFELEYCNAAITKSYDLK